MAVNPCCGCSLQTGTKVVALVGTAIQIGAIILFITSIVLVSQKYENTQSLALHGQESNLKNGNSATISRSGRSVRNTFEDYGDYDRHVPPTSEAGTNRDDSSLSFKNDKNPLPSPVSFNSREQNDASFSSEYAEEFISIIISIGKVRIVFLGITVFSVFLMNLILNLFLFKDAQKRTLDGCRNWFVAEAVFTIVAFARLLFFIIKFGFGVIVLVSMPFHIFDVYSLWVVGAFIQQLAHDKGQGVAQFVGLASTLPNETQLMYQTDV